MNVEVLKVADYWRVRVDGKLVSSHHRGKEADKAAADLRRQARLADRETVKP